MAEPRRRQSDRDGSTVDPAEFGRLAAMVDAAARNQEATARILDTHLRECAESNKDLTGTVATLVAQVSANAERFAPIPAMLNKLVVAVAVLAGAVLGKEGLVDLITKVSGP